MGGENKKVYEDLYEKYRVQEPSGDVKKPTEEEKRKALNDAYRKSNRGYNPDRSKDSGCFGNCLGECGEECCEIGCEHACDALFCH